MDDIGVDSDVAENNNIVSNGNNSALKTDFQADQQASSYHNRLENNENLACQSLPSGVTNVEDTDDKHTKMRPGCSKSNEDQEFDYQVNEGDTDDEETIDEEEQETAEDEEELNDLAKEGEMPLDDVIALYYSKPENYKTEQNKSSDNENEDNESRNEENDSYDNDEESRQLRSTASLLSPSRPDSGDEENDHDYIPPAPEDWKKAPRVGDEYQVDLIPEQSQQVPDYDDSTDQMIWCPSKIDNEKVEDYLLSVGGAPSTSTAASSSSNLRDNEDALFLLSQCDHDVTEAIRRYKQKPPPLASELAVWSLEECRQFEHGLSMYGKDFHVIHHNKVKTKSVGEIVKFYYIWKKTRWYDNFSAKTRLGKKKDPLHPGVTNFMDRLLDETEISISQQGHHGNTSSSSHPPLSHSAALQQHFHDHQFTRKQHQEQHPSNTYGSDPQAHEYPEMNGLYGEEYVDDMEMFDNIVPTLPANHVFPPVPFSSVDPGINVSYSDPGQFAPISTTILHPESATPISLGAANQNNNCHVTEPSNGHNRSLSDSQTFHPLIESVCVTTDFPSASEGVRTTTLPPDVLSSIDELETAYCFPSGGDASLPYSSSQSTPLDSISVDSPSETRGSLNLKRFHSNSSADLPNDDAKRRKTDENELHDDKASEGSSCASQSALAHQHSSSEEVTNKSMADSSVAYQTTSQGNLSHENRSDVPRIASC